MSTKAIHRSRKLLYIAAFSSFLAWPVVAQFPPGFVFDDFSSGSRSRRGEPPKIAFSGDITHVEITYGFGRKPIGAQLTAGGRDYAINSQTKLLRIGLPATVQDIVVGDFAAGWFQEYSGQKLIGSLQVVAKLQPESKYAAAKRKAAGEAAALKWHKESADRGERYGQ